MHPADDALGAEGDVAEARVLRAQALEHRLAVPRAEGRQVHSRQKRFPHAAQGKLVSSPLSAFNGRSGTYIISGKTTQLASIPSRHVTVGSPAEPPQSSVTPVAAFRHPRP